MNSKSILIYGGTGQAKMIRSIANSMFLPFDKPMFFLVDDTDGLKPPFNDLAWFDPGEGSYGRFKNWVGSDEALCNFEFAIAIGNPNAEARQSLHWKLLKDGMKSRNWIHSTAYIDPDANIFGIGNQIHPHAVINPQVFIADCSIINTKALVEHGCRIGSGVEIGPSATLCGQIVVEDNVWVGAGAVVLPNLILGKGCTIGAGAVVTKSVQENTVVAGVPAKPI